MKPTIKYWQTFEQLQKGWSVSPTTLYDSPTQRYEEEAEFDELHEDALIQELVKNKYIICGDTHQNYAIPVFNDGYIMLSMRRWSEIMEDAYVYMDRDNHRDHDFYMACVCDIEEKLPNG